MAIHRTCDGVTRRDFVKIGSLGLLGGLTLPELLQLEAAAAPAPGAKEKAVILLWLGGGPSHMDTFDPKPDAPKEYRGEFGGIGTKAGFQISDQLPKLAGVADRFSVIRSVTHPEGAHERGTTYMLTGYRQIPGFDYPGYGSVVAREKGWQNNMPPYVAVPGVIDYAASGYLGAEGSPFAAGDPGDGNNYQVRDIVLPGYVKDDRLARRREFLAAADSIVRTGRADDPVTGIDRFYGRAYDIVTSAHVRQAFDLKQEPDAVRDQYGKNGLGQGLLLARRLLEGGVRFVTVHRGGWDNHSNIFNDLKRYRLPELDQGVSALLTDLAQRGMLDRTLVVVMGEFGRTPQVNGMGGRDHWPKVMSVAMAGGGIRGGIAVGTSNEKGEEPAARPVKPEDIAFTLFTCLGINPDKVYHTPQGRPIRIAQDGEVIKELL